MPLWFNPFERSEGGVVHKTPIESVVFPPVKVLHIFGRMQRGGAETVILELMRHIDRTRYLFHFCALSGRTGPLDDEIRELGGDVYPLRVGMKFLHGFRKLLRDKKIDVVHSHVHLFSGVILMLAARSRVPVRVVHFHSLTNANADRWSKRLQNFLMRQLLNRYATHIVAVSEGVMNSAWGKNWRNDPRCCVIYNGLANAECFDVSQIGEDARGEFGISDENVLVIHVGRMTPAKNHLRLLDIFAEFLRQAPSAFLLLVGARDPDIDLTINERLLTLGLEGRVVIAGERTDVPRLLRAADVMLFPSLREGLPGVVIEACAAQTPVVASDLAGVVEIASHLPGHVTCVPLNASDAVWSARLLEACCARQDVRERVGQKVVTESVFNVGRQLKLTCRLWGATHG